ncbi:MAG: hypothetical protein AAGF96_06035 [Bacteroidota bacterium]
MKTATISLDMVKDSDGWNDLGHSLGFDHEKINKVFEYGEYANLTIEVNENLEIVGGKIHPKEVIE